MITDISPAVYDQLPLMVKESLSRLSPQQRHMFVSEFQRKRKDPILMLVLAILFPIQLLLLGKTGLWLLFFFTGGGLGWWWIIEIFFAMKRTRAFNEDLAVSVTRDLKILAQ